MKSWMQRKIIEHKLRLLKKVSSAPPFWYTVDFRVSKFWLVEQDNDKEKYIHHVEFTNLDDLEQAVTGLLTIWGNYPDEPRTRSAAVAELYEGMAAQGKVFRFCDHDEEVEP